MITGHVVVDLASVGESTIQKITNMLIIERAIYYHDTVLFNIARSITRSPPLAPGGEADATAQISRTWPYGLVGGGRHLARRLHRTH